MNVGTAEAYSIKQVSGNNVLFSKSGNIALVYILENPDKYNLDEEKFDQRLEDLFFAFRTTPNDVYIHKQDVYLKQDFDPSIVKGDLYLDEALRKHFTGRKGIKHYSVLSFVLTGLKSLSKNYLSNPFQFSEKLQSEDRLILSEFADSVDKSCNIINTIYRTKISPLEENDLRFHIYQYVNGFEDAGYYDIDFRDKKIGENYLDIFSFNKAEYFGDHISNIKKDAISKEDFTVWEGTMDMLGETLNCNHIYNQIIYFKGDKIVENELRMVMDEYGKVKTGSERNNSKFKQFEDLLKSIADQGSDKLLVKAHYNLIVFDKDKDEFEKARSTVKRLLNENSINFYKPEKEVFKDIFLGSIIGRQSSMHIDNYFITHLKQALCLWTNTTVPKSDEEGVFFNDRMFQLPLKIDNWDVEGKRISARNTITVAQTGGGKSVQALNIVTQQLSQGINVVVVEFGQSFKFITNLYPEISKHISYNSDQPLGINPFILTEQGLTNEKLDLLQSIVLKTWRVKENMQNAHIGVSVNKLIKEYYNQRKFGFSYPDFYNFVVTGGEDLLNKLDIDKEYFDLKSFKHICSEFTEGGKYENIFKESEETTKIIKDTQFVVFELTKIKTDPFLVTLILLILQETINSNILEDRSKRGALYFDEFAETGAIRDLYTGEEVMQTVAVLYQKIRKENGSVNIIIQDMGQLPDNNYTQGIIANTQIVYILPTSEAGYIKIAEVFKFSKHDLYLMKSLKSNKKAKYGYTEQFIKIDDYSMVTRLELSKPALLSFQTDGALWKELNDDLAITGNMIQTIENKIKKLEYEKRSF
ncbi:MULTISPECIES: VirB4 family type IV secretion system protein [unclassified Chryseobacterium]|uniref:VirB4 family type IV secretion system protein n=1 Tax=unclassified Chryseobacterium TaxID=2593645 RepID=UPI0028532C8A|nr:hypothetical protein [Chryseobacterium sp. CFS7]MDR4895102.1 hypothetical protein [Chryseobacterium sp. CFS7]